MINIVICDDDTRELQKTKNLCQSYADAHKEIDIRIESFAMAAELLKKISEGQYQYDVLLLDIYMPELTGVELARKLRERQDNCQIVFLTTSKEHAVEAFSLHAAHYLVKPYTGAQLENALDKAIAAIEKAKKANLLLKTSIGLQKINMSDILYSETDKHIQIIHLQNGACLQVRITCGDLFDLLSCDSRFYKCGSTYIINLDKLTKITTKNLLLQNGEELPMQRRQYKELVERYMNFLLDNK
jgi:DNA-binding LytR/AlgR family response regulator